jgi:glycosyltransferase involved in cell wall biosynthesis
MIKKEIISTVIPTFNREAFLKDAIISCLNQTIKHEIIVCNHGGTDGTDIMVKQFQNKIKYIKKDIDYGPHFCWLDGIMQAKGEYINLLFDDDWIKPTFIEKCMKYFNDDVGFVFTNAEIFDDSIKEVTKKIHDKFITKSGVYNISQYEFYFLRFLISPTSIIIRKKDIIDSLFQGKLPFAKNIYKGVGPDRLMILLCILRYKKFGYVSEDLSVYRGHINSITINSYSNKIKKKQIKKAYNEVINYYYTLKYGKYFSYLNNRLVIYTKYYVNLLFINILKFLKNN